MINVIYAVII